MTDNEERLRLAALRALAALELANLDDECDENAVIALAGRARARCGDVAAICVWPRFVALAREQFAANEVKVVAAVNFPHGDGDIGAVAAEAERAVADGADDIDMLIPWAAFLEGRDAAISSAVSRVKRAAGAITPVRAILETGVMETSDRIERAACLALEGGADFLATSSGKVAAGATARAARTLLETIRDQKAEVGIKITGALRKTADAAACLWLADEVMGEGWATPARFRIGASDLIDALSMTIDRQCDPEPAEAEG